MNHKIFIVSGGTGRTAKQVIKASLTQFPDKTPEIVLFSEIREMEKIIEIIKYAKESNVLIVHTLVDDELRLHLENECNNLDVKSVDIIGNTISKLSNLFSSKPLQTPGLFNKINQEYFKRIDAVQFAFNHDDGARIDDINKAEIILLGVSRTFKTPLSIYLAYKGIFVANVPIIDGIIPPKILNNIDPSKIFCLNTNAMKLSELRKSRNIKLGEFVEYYSDIDNVKKELNFAKRYYTLHPDWKIINVTGKSIEEIATEILSFRELNFSSF
jgi:[pyruvate, water dikinase]-phosphate phosphotransferase / [pyruvate, water dikinase] kinase